MHAQGVEFYCSLLSLRFGNLCKHYIFPLPCYVYIPSIHPADVFPHQEVVSTNCSSVLPPSAVRNGGTNGATITFSSLMRNPTRARARCSGGTE